MKIYISDDDMCTTQKLNLARVQKWFEANGCQIVEDPANADRNIIMTCNGWSLLESRSYTRISEIGNLYPEKSIVMGCVVDAHPKKVRELFKGPVVETKSDLALSFSGIENLFKNFSIPLNDIPAQSVFRRREDYREYNLKRRFINIAEGCAFTCTFCTHKPGLGKRRSRREDDIIQQVQKCIDEGVDTIVLMGMETGMYGIEYKTNLANLLVRLIDLNDSFEIHVGQFNPHGVHLFSSELLSIMGNKRITDFQLPIQSTSPRLLKMMNRKDFSSEVGGFISELRKINKRIVLRTDVIVGWPTETDDERQQTLDFVAKHFDEVAVYSIELSPDLPAWKYQTDAYSPLDLQRIQFESREYLRKFGIVVHSGQQEDPTMENAEKQRRALRETKWSIS